MDDPQGRNPFGWNVHTLRRAMAEHLSTGRELVAEQQSLADACRAHGEEPPAELVEFIATAEQQVEGLAARLRDFDAEHGTGDSDPPPAVPEGDRARFRAMLPRLSDPPADRPET